MLTRFPVGEASRCSHVVYAPMNLQLDSLADYRAISTQFYGPRYKAAAPVGEWCSP